MFYLLDPFTPVQIPPPPPTSVISQQRRTMEIAAVAIHINAGHERVQKLLLVCFRPIDFNESVWKTHVCIFGVVLRLKAGLPHKKPPKKT